MNISKNSRTLILSNNNFRFKSKNCEELSGYPFINSKVDKGVTPKLLAIFAFESEVIV